MAKSSKRAKNASQAYLKKEERHERLATEAVDRLPMPKSPSKKAA